MEITSTSRGFRRGEFRDLYGSECSIQDSSLATSDAIWLGVMRDFDGRECTRMHLTREMVEGLMPALQRFIDSGSINPDNVAETGLE